MTTETTIPVLARAYRPITGESGADVGPAGVIAGAAPSRVVGWLGSNRDIRFESIVAA